MSQILGMPGPGDENGTVYIGDYIGILEFILGLYRDNGKENGNQFKIIGYTAWFLMYLG